jgi:hypothetical protein
MEKANAGAVILDYAFGDLALAFEELEAILGVSKLMLQRVGVGVAARDAFV